jgi:hypothetical protein
MHCHSQLSVASRCLVYLFQEAWGRRSGGLGRGQNPLRSHVVHWWENPSPPSYSVIGSLQEEPHSAVVMPTFSRLLEHILVHHDSGTEPGKWRCLLTGWDWFKLLNWTGYKHVDWGSCSLPPRLVAYRELGLVPALQDTDLGRMDYGGTSLKVLAHVKKWLMSSLRYCPSVLHNHWNSLKHG